MSRRRKTRFEPTVRPGSPLFLTEMIRVAEEEASCELYGLLKRADEKYVTEHAYNNPKFVEDLVRDIALRCNKEDRIRYAFRLCLARNPKVEEITPLVEHTEEEFTRLVAEDGFIEHHRLDRHCLSRYWLRSPRV